ncbi:hypothetical protein WJX73_000970 [Symbiochloris irregularis]|uniref:C2 domain-containing protein n=1 Tax=Symbiochloris irregularis TaxID=706552 RepID=A0AAW1PR41_9CHLO
MISDKGIVIEDITVKNLGRQTSSLDHNSHSPFLKFQVGDETCKTTTKKHVGHDIFWENETLRFKAGDARDTLTITALHRRAVFTHSKKFIGQARVPVKDLGATNTVTLKSSGGRDTGEVSFNIKGVVPLAAAAEIAGEKAKAAAPTEEPTTEVLPAENVGDNIPEQQPHVLPETTEITTTTRSKRTTTTTITDTAHILHEKAPEEDAEAHMLIEAGKQKLLEDQAERQLARKPTQGESVMLTFGVLCKLLLASYLAFLDVIMTRAVEFVGSPHLAPRRLLQLDTPVSKSSSLSHPAPTKVPSILQRTEAEVLEEPQEHANSAAATSLPHDLNDDKSALRSFWST